MKRTQTTTASRAGTDHPLNFADDALAAMAVRRRRNLVDLSSHNTNPPSVFDGEAVPLSDVADTRIEESVAALREFVAERGSLPTAGDMRPRRFGTVRPGGQIPGPLGSRYL
jgi:hypothetical protein